LTEGRAWSDWALSTPLAKEISARTGMLYCLNAIMTMHQGDLQAADNAIEEQLNIGYSIEDDAVVGIGLTIKGMLLTQQGKHDPAFAMLTLSRKVTADIKLDWWAVDGLLTQATASLGLGDANGALQLVQEAETISKNIHSDWMTAYAYNLYGEVYRMLGNFEIAANYYQRGESLLQEQGDQGGELPRIIHSQGYTALHLGQFDEAEYHFRRSLEIFSHIGSRRGMAECLAGLAVVLTEEGNYLQAVTLLSAASATLKQFGAQWWPTDKIEVEQAMRKLRSNLSPEAFHSAWEEGQSLGLNNAIARSQLSIKT
jgi:tetratricopeptide (TPR) repeat protein